MKTKTHPTHLDSWILSIYYQALYYDDMFPQKPRGISNSDWLLFKFLLKESIEEAMSNEPIEREATIWGVDGNPVTT